MVQARCITDTLRPQVMLCKVLVSFVSDMTRSMKRCHNKFHARLFPVSENQLIGCSLTRSKVNLRFKLRKIAFFNVDMRNLDPNDGCNLSQSK